MTSVCCADVCLAAVCAATSISGGDVVQRPHGLLMNASGRQWTGHLVAPISPPRRVSGNIWIGARKGNVLRQPIQM
eukprot:CAMPEP_0197658958 /NCGR_PEP_ID=MMETSP1338-20131121/45566_1 /TAXON_ID=43686 ORGANISM="Pelagodinium beii, Strain RCC1491" /NCGR_SAMPLE_ID=MMETSP1338 /ASSEMBLY_ACC=CAM_ASM_000754 /LENGTH=75 /DNA_ID=CAMNT_0043235657 /DNA_START=62 /DNA_END=289 /DNA_ORIENTATION=-